MPLLESDPDVFRYAWFSRRTDAIPHVDLLGARGELTTLGELYVSLRHEEECSS
ncbi:glycosyl hydrolase [Sorangium sp. So ce124]|uniref:glycosyl hydrolase n=1 Tax=Sorangium sp. So ce124 TaxID=3133280 RepID=UPI003F641FD6